MADVPPTAEHAYEAALAAFQARELESARQGFAGILALTPHWDRVRFDFARTLSRLGQVEEATNQLEILLRADLPVYRSLIREAPALQNVRDAEVMLGLDQMIARLQGRWEEHLANGWPTIEFRAAPELKEGEPPEYYPKHNVRAGVFVPSTQRFLPVGGIVPDATAVLVDANTRRVLSVQADATVDLFSLMLNVSWRVDPWLSEIPSAVVLGSPDEDDATFAAIDISLGPGATTWRMFEEFEDLTVGSSDAHDERGIVLRVLGEGSLLLSSAPNGVRLSGDHLFITSKRMIRLSPGHEISQYHSFVQHNAGLYVLSTQYGCDASNPDGLPVPVQRHVVDYVDTNAGTVTPISEGSGAASAVVLPGGRVAIQRGHRLDVVAPGEHGLEHAQRLPEGLLLHVPLRMKNCVYH